MSERKWLIMTGLPLKERQTESYTVRQHSPISRQGRKGCWSNHFSSFLVTVVPTLQQSFPSWHRFSEDHCCLLKHGRSCKHSLSKCLGKDLLGIQWQRWAGRHQTHSKALPVTQTAKSPESRGTNRVRTPKCRREGIYVHTGEQGLRRQVKECPLRARTRTWQVHTSSPETRGLQRL